MPHVPSPAPPTDTLALKPARRKCWAVAVAGLNQPPSLRWFAWTVLVLALIHTGSGCAPLDLPARLPSQAVLKQADLLVYSDFQLAPGHRLLEQLPARRAELEASLGFPLAVEPISVYLFADEATFARYARQNLPGFASRRAMFVKTDTRLMVLAHWQDQLGEDLRHELTHAYLHATLTWIPLWLDEGLAEYFEISSLAQPVHARHVYHLAREFKAGRWQPNLERLEAFADPAQLNETQYAESWLWVHFLLSTSAERREVFQRYAAELHHPNALRPQLSAHLGSERAAWELAILEHLKELATGLAGTTALPTGGGQTAAAPALQ